MADVVLQNVEFTAGVFALPAVFSFAAGAALTLRNCSIQTACDRVNQQQRLACALLPWAAIRVYSGGLTIAGWSRGNLTATWLSLR
jgi:hypothetical protein